MQHTAPPTILHRLLGEFPAEVFLERHYLRLPFSRPGGCRELAHLGSWQIVEQLAGSAGLDVLIGREGTLREKSRSLPFAEVRRFFAEGQTIGLRHVHAHHPELALLAAEFQEAFAAAVDIHLYCTPAGAPGFGWHYDAEEVFVLQTLGSKEWRLRKNTMNPWPLIETIPPDQHYEREIMPLLSCGLEAGDWLYIPGGYWHSTQADAESISLSVGILPPTAIDLFDFLRTRLLASIEWRQRLPVCGSASSSLDEELIVQYQTILHGLQKSLLAELSGEPLARSFLAAQREMKSVQSE